MNGRGSAILRGDGASRERRGATLPRTFCWSLLLLGGVALLTVPAAVAHGASGTGAPLHPGSSNTPADNCALVCLSVADCVSDGSACTVGCALGYPDACVPLGASVSFQLGGQAFLECSYAIAFGNGQTASGSFTYLGQTPYVTYNNFGPVTVTVDGYCGSTYYSSTLNMDVGSSGLAVPVGALSALVGVVAIGASATSASTYTIPRLDPPTPSEEAVEDFYYDGTTELETDFWFPPPAPLPDPPVPKGPPPDFQIPHLPGPPPPGPIQIDNASIFPAPGVPAGSVSMAVSVSGGDPTATPYSYTWWFDDGTAPLTVRGGNFCNFVHWYQKPGPHTIRLEIRSGDGVTSQSWNVVVPGPSVP